MSHRTRSLGSGSECQASATAPIVAALTRGNVDERKVEPRAQLRQVLRDTYIELGRVSRGPQLKESWLEARTF